MAEKYEKCLKTLLSGNVRREARERETNEEERREKTRRRRLLPFHPRQPLRANICWKGENGTDHREKVLEICEGKSLFTRVIRVVIREITKETHSLLSALSDGSSWQY